ncbi:MAG TPA: hypothetical protein VGR00_11865 [Thermoanaerobaculia bacterium]|nr:hypothetical protein [Thermoanaerobaculia bacterium]
MPPNERQSRAEARRRAIAASLTLGLLAAAFIGRAVISIDGAEVVSVSLGLFVTGRFEAAMLPSADLLPVPAFHSHYGLFPSLLPVPSLAVAWPLRAFLGGPGLDGFVALTWAAGALLAAIAFHRLASVFREGLSPLFVPAFLGGTFLWPYAADSFFDPFSAAAFAFAAQRVLRERESRPSDFFVASVLWSAGCWLRPILWVTAPVFLLAALLRVRERSLGSRVALGAFFGLGAGLAVALAVNTVYQGSPFHFGYVLSSELPFWHPLGAGLYGLLLSPGRGLVFFAPVVLLAPFGLRRRRAAAWVLALGAPAVLALVIARWFVWNGGSCWGPRYLLAVLPLLAAPAVLAPAGLLRAAFALGALLNLPGVLVAPGAFISYAERLAPPPGIAWPPHGPDRVSEVAALSPLYGHVWLFANGLVPSSLPAPWLHAGAKETAPRPGLGDFVSPLLVRRALGLPPIPPFSPRLLSRTAAAYAVRGRPREARLFAGEALALDPNDALAREVVSATPP